ncbi:uncharacterized protein TNCV_3504321 [Trichonephila clavipes]|uniref:Uncharacterized protein n=1 Tax=Trichonephila clavipes TaxID=2585209 RepID=A0A8X6RVG4_TRICX|nr:uncharacterized protein TNCV_3504321 [Trichonephila clavipes]
MSIELIYKNPENPASFGGVNALYRALDNRVKTKDIKQCVWLETKDSYTSHKPARRRFRRSRVLVGGMEEQFQADLLDLRSLSQYNNGYKYLLTCIDVFSKACLGSLRDKNSIEESAFVADPQAAFPVFYVYSEFVQPVVVGHVEAPLLRVVRISGDAVSAQYDRPHYVPVILQSFHTFEIEIRLNSGDLLPFERDNEEGLKKRSAFFESSASVDMIGPLHCDLFNQERLLLNLVDLKIKFIRSKPEFCLHGKKGYKVTLEKITLLVRKVHVSPGVVLGHMKALEKETAHYLFLFKNPRDKSQIMNIGKQLYPGKSQFFREVYEDATSKPFN